MTRKSKLEAIGGLVLAAILCLAAILITNNVTRTGTSARIEYSNGEHSATMTIGEDDVTNEDSEEYGLGAEGEEVEVEDVQTVEEIDHNGPVVDTDSGDDVSVVEDGEEHGLGTFIYAPTASWSEFKNYTLGNCYNTDYTASTKGYGAQCWDLADVFFQNYANRRAQTCGTGAAKGMIKDGCWQKNAGDEFEMIWDASKIKAGDWVVFTNGTWGHIGMAVGSYNNGYVTLLGQNQGGGYCEGGGSATNIINISLKNFGGAFRPKIYIEPEPKPEPAPTPKPSAQDSYVVKKGDTLGGIIRKLGWYDGKNLFGDDGYAQKVASANGIKWRGLIYPGQEIRKV